jgi:hypothetical protein
VSGIQQELTLEDDALEETLANLFELNNDEKDWAGPGTSTFKRMDDTNKLRGYGFLSFLSKEGAMVAVEAINTTSSSVSTNLGCLQAALSHCNAKTTNTKTGSKKQGPKQGQSQSSNASLRLRRRRAPPAPKHPVKSSSDTARLYRSMQLSK